MRAMKALAMVAVLLPTNAVAARDLTLSEEFGVCLRSSQTVEIARHVVIDVEKVYLSDQRNEVAEFVFDEFGIGAYNQLIKGGPVKGTPFSAGSGVTVYAQLFQGEAMVFVARVVEPTPTWIYVTFYGIDNSARAAQAVAIMKGLRSCKSG